MMATEVPVVRFMEIGKRVLVLESSMCDKIKYQEALASEVKKLGIFLPFPYFCSSSWLHSILFV